MSMAPTPGYDSMFDTASIRALESKTKEENAKTCASADRVIEGATKIARSPTASSAFRLPKRPS